MKQAREHRHTVRLSEQEEKAAQILMHALGCKSIPAMFRAVLNRYNKLRAILIGIKDALHKGDR